MTKNDVESFLTKCKIACLSNFIVEYTPKNKITLTELGFTQDDVFDEVMSLTTENYVEGPLSDHGGYKGEFWVFGKTINDTEIYIKVKIKDLNEDGDKQLTTLCISFHKSEKQLIYLFK